MQLENIDQLKQNLADFLNFNSPINVFGINITPELFYTLLPENSFIFIDARELEGVFSLINHQKNFVFFIEKIYIFANINCNKSLFSYLKQFKTSIIFTSEIYLDYGIPLEVKYTFNFNNFLDSFTKKFLKVERNNFFAIRLTMLNERVKNQNLDLNNRIHLYDAFNELFDKDISNELYLNEETIFKFKKEEVKHLLNEEYFFSADNIKILYNILQNIKNKENVILHGEPGTGKTFLIEFLSRKFNKKLNILNISSDTEISDFTGKYILKDKNIIFKEGILIRTIKENGWLLLDEINLASKEVLDFIESLISKRFFYFQGIIKYTEDFLIFGCMNLNDVGKKNFENFYFIRKELKTTNEDFEGIAKKINPNFYFLDFPMTNKREFCRAQTLLKEKFDLNYILKLIYNKKVEGKKIFCDSVPDYIITEENSILVERAEMAIETGFPLLLQGDTSTGKTSLIVALAKKYNKKLHRINNHDQTESADYFGEIINTEAFVNLAKNHCEKDTSIEIYSSRSVNYQSTLKNGENSSLKGDNKNLLNEINLAETNENPKILKTDFSQECEVFSEKLGGILGNAIKNGDWILLDELNLAPTEVLEVLNKILDTRYEEFRLFATQNLGYSGRKLLSKAFLSRFIILDFSKKNLDEIKKILCFKYPNPFNHKIVQFYDKIRIFRNFNELITLRDCFRWSKRIKTPKDFFNSGLITIYERQRKNDRIFIEKMFNELGNFEDYLQFIDQSFINSGFKEENFILTRSLKKLIILILDAFKYKEPVLIVGETGIGKSKAIECVCKFLKRDFITISMCSNTDVSDFIGSFSLSNGQVYWSDGPLLKAMKEGKVLIIDEINLAENSILERLNSLLEDERSIFITETNTNIKAHENFLLIGSMNPSTDIGKRELSLALKNRFTEIYFELCGNEKREICEQILELNSFNKLIQDCNQTNQPKTDYIHLILNNLQSNTLRSVDLIEDSIITFKKYCKNIEDQFKYQINTPHTVYFNQKLNVQIDKYLNECKTKLKEYFIDHYYSLELTSKNDYLFINNEIFGIFPFLYFKKCDSNYFFNAECVKSNLFSLLRAIELDKPILIEGDCGTGKTSLITEVAKIIGKKIFRANLCDSTEISDLIGQFTPSNNKIEFKEGVISSLRDGHWLILDEINLCSQSVLEGLNSILDFRRQFTSTYLTFKVHPESRIFGTMNKSTQLNRRNFLPRSFLDRFIKLNFSFTINDIQCILKNLNMTFYGGSLRYNILANKIKKDYMRNYMSLESQRTALFNIFKLKKLLTGDVSNYMTKYNFRLNAIIHSQLNETDTFLRCLELKIPVIIKGVAKQNLINLIKTEKIYCHDEIDISDLIGQFTKTENNDFIWTDSHLINNLKNRKNIYFDSADLIDKTVLDRINDLLEDRIIIFEHENEEIENNSFIILGCETNLSPAIEDRCVIINLSVDLTNLDVYKMFGRYFYSQKLVDGIENVSEIIFKSNPLETSNATLIDNFNEANPFLFMEKIINEGLLNTEFISKELSDQLAVFLVNLKKIVEFNKILDTSKFTSHNYEQVQLDLLKYKYLKKVPEYLKFFVPILNFDEAKQIFTFEELRFNDLKYELFDFYNSNCFFYKDSINPSDSLKYLLNEGSANYQRNNFIKRVSSLPKLTTIPYGIKELKKYVISKKLNQYKEDLLNINFEIDLEPDERFFKLLESEIDPLIMKKEQKLIEIFKFYNFNINLLNEHFFNLYYLGTSDYNFDEFIYRLHHLIDEYSSIPIRKNYVEFIKNIYEIDIFYQNKDFDDIINYYKLFLIGKPNIKTFNCEKCLYFDDHKSCAEFANLIDAKDLYLFVLDQLNKSNENFDWFNFIKQINFNDLKPTISRLFVDLTTAQWNLPNNSTNFNHLKLIIELCDEDYKIRSKESLKNQELTHTILNEALKCNFMCEKKDFKYLLILFYKDFLFNELQKYFLDSKFYEFKERILFSKIYLKQSNFDSRSKNFQHILYNLTLLMDLFKDKEVERNTYTLSIIENPQVSFNKKKGCLCKLNFEKICHYKSIKDVNLPEITEFCFCKKKFVDKSLDLNEIFYSRMPNVMFSKEERLIAYLFFKSKDFTYQLKQNFLFGMFNCTLPVLERIISYIEIEEKYENNGCIDDCQQIEKENEMSQDNTNSDLNLEDQNEETEESGIEGESELENLEESGIEMESENESELEKENENELKSEGEVNSNLEENIFKSESSDSFVTGSDENTISNEFSEFESTENEISGKEEFFDKESNLDESLDDLPFLNEENDCLLENDLQNTNIDLQVNTEQCCKEAINYTTKVQEDSFKLQKEELFIILKNTFIENKRNKYKGDFKTGKRINMRRIVTFVMSNFTKDKIFMRRNKENKKEYLINIYIDNSKSMQKYNLQNKLTELLTAFKYSFDKLQIPFSIFTFGEEIKEIKFTDTFAFDEEKSNLTLNDGYNLVLTDGIVNCTNKGNTLFLFLNKELRNMKQVVFEDQMKVLNYLDLVDYKYCLVEEDFLYVFAEAIREVVMGN